MQDILRCILVLIVLAAFVISVHVLANFGVFVKSPSIVHDNAGQCCTWGILIETD